MKQLGYSIFLILLGLSSIAAAPIYSWQDEQGRVHFSDRPLDHGAQKLSPQYDTQAPQDNAEEPAAQPEHQYSIRNQIEYFDQKREAERQAWLEERKFRQEERSQKLDKEYLEQQAEQQSQSDTGYLNSYPYYRPYRPGRPHRPNRPDRPHYQHPKRGVQVHSPYSEQLLIQQGDKTTPLNRYPSYPLNFWKH